MVQASITVSDSGDIQVVPEPISLRGQGNGAVVIQWQINTSGWNFTSSGIGINNGNFQNGTVDPGNGQRYTWTRKPGGADSSTVKYSITVRRGNDSPKTLDPNINNEP